MFHDGGYFMGGAHLVWWIVWIGVLAMILFYGWRRSADRPGASRESPRDVLQRRLASGEITPDDYESRKALLDRDAGPRA
jgi:putative membrane protein